MKNIVKAPRNSFVQARAEQSVLLVDARNYYRTLYRALEQASDYVLLCGWQFDSGVALLRGEDAEHAERPVTLLKFLDALCQERPKLRVYLLAWDFSVIYAMDREWMQRVKFSYATNSRVRFEWDEHPVAGASHHQKFVVVDGVLAFVGGIDICDARWDDCDHRPDNPYRVNLEGEPCKPYHDVQTGLTGEIVGSIVDLFAERWQRACGERLEFSVPEPAAAARFSLSELSRGESLTISSKRAALSRTQADPRAGSEKIREVLSLICDAVSAAERLIYIETQYFTSRSVAKVLIERMSDQRLPKLEVVIVMPHGADSPKEKLALGDTQDAVLAAVSDTARRTGHELRILYSASSGKDDTEFATYIHAKLLIVDDELLMVGSPNLTERSVGLDTELAVVWECENKQDPLHGCIRNIRTTLLAEHSGLEPLEFENEQGLCRRLDDAIREQRTRLRHREISRQPSEPAIFAQIFDPGDPSTPGAVLEGAEETLLTVERDNWFVRGIRELTQQLRKAVERGNGTRTIEPSSAAVAIGEDLDQSRGSMRR